MNILIADKFESSGIEQLESAGFNVTLNPELQGDALRDAIVETACEVLIVRSTKVEPPAITASNSLKLVIRAGSGYDTIDIAAAAENGVRVCNCPGMNAVAVAELTLGMMLALDRRIVDGTVDLRRGVWNKKEYSKARGLKGRTIGVVGLGRIGYEIAKRAAAFDMDLLYTDEIERKDLEHKLGIRKVALDELLRSADFVTLHVPGGDATRHMIGAPQLATMKPTAFVLNCSRGGIVDEKALSAAIEAGTIAGAALDVYEIEPAANDREFADPVVRTARVYGTHHIGASTEQAQLAVADEAVKIVKAYSDRGEFLHCVNVTE